jgi:hypothetical protein
MEEYMTKKKQARKFNYAVGHYWEGESGSVGLYSYGGEIFYGTMEQAQGFLKYIQDMDVKEKKKADRRDWRIFQLIEVPV